MRKIKQLASVIIKNDLLYPECRNAGSLPEDIFLEFSHKTSELTRSHWLILGHSL
jgi:hypothetical protein